MTEDEIKDYIDSKIDITNSRGTTGVKMRQALYEIVSQLFGQFIRKYSESGVDVVGNVNKLITIPVDEYPGSVCGVEVIDSSLKVITGSFLISISTSMGNQVVILNGSKTKTNLQVNIFLS